MLAEIHAYSLEEAIRVVESKYRTGYDSVFIAFKTVHSELNPCGFTRVYSFAVEAEETCLHEKMCERIDPTITDVEDKIPKWAIQTICRDCGEEIK